MTGPDLGEKATERRLHICGQHYNGFGKVNGRDCEAVIVAYSQRVEVIDKFVVVAKWSLFHGNNSVPDMPGKSTAVQN